MSSARAKHPFRRHVGLSSRLQPGAVPGAMVPLPDSGPAVVTVMTLDREKARPPVPVQDFRKLPLPDPNAEEGVWVRVCGLGQVEPLMEIAGRYGLPRLSMADAVSPGWRSKMEESGDYLFFVIQSPMLQDGIARSEHLSFFIRDNVLVSFEDEPTALVDSLWERFAAANAYAGMRLHANFLAYLAVDYVIDRFFPILDQKGEALAALEEAISQGEPTQEELRQLHEVKRDISTLRRLLSPYRDLGAGLRRHRLDEETRDIEPFLDDLRSHVLQAADLIDAYQEVANSLSDIYQATLTNRMNAIIKVLTVISTLFMPLSFIAGVYGMNFDGSVSPWNMPELRLAFGYPLALGMMAGVAVCMLWFFKRRKWL
ncbi:MAG: magnesium/cobalt transporter CorA [Desulfovibrio sp.]|jgi:magnesium transporter|nr:magnesium/cobalt transporter CorA [Desulfovibrio sp.]